MLALSNPNKLAKQGKSLCAALHTQTIFHPLDSPLPSFVAIVGPFNNTSYLLADALHTAFTAYRRPHIHPPLVHLRLYSLGNLGRLGIGVPV